MSITVNTNESNKTSSIKISGKFDFSVQREFRDAYRDNNEAGMEYIIDLSQTEYIDSSALGMLLLIKEHAEAQKGNVRLVRPASAIQKILTMANFEQLFQIEQ